MGVLWMKKKLNLLIKIKRFLLSTSFGPALLELKRAIIRKINKTPPPFRETISLLAAGVTAARTVADLNPAMCSGCGGCFNGCPVNAIRMTRDPEGYLIPAVDPEVCVNCGKCVKICPVLNTRKENRANPPCFAVMAEDDLRKESSSGGAFSLLADQVLSGGGYVCGAAMDRDFRVKHIIIHSAEDLPRLRLSKYVQSDTGDVFSRIRSLLENGEQVMFTGCPCQSAGLKGYLGKEYPNLLAVDLVCHGGPSQMVFDRYLEDTYGKDAVESFVFRTKKFGHSSFYQITRLKNGQEIIGSIAFDPYEKCMHSGIAVKDVCRECPFAPVPRQGDLTIGDFWHIAEEKPEYSDGLGTSVLLCNNEKGDAAFERIRGKCKLAAPMPLASAVDHNRFRSHMNAPAGRGSFFAMLRTRSFEDALHYAMNGRYDVGVIGLWHGKNYGSMLTYYALNRALTSMGLSVLMISSPLASPYTDEAAKLSPFRLARRFYNISQIYPMDRMAELNSQCDAFVVGSDQLWNAKLSRPFKQTYFLDFVDKNRKKISVATSFARPYTGTEAEKFVNSHFLRQFDWVSVRDEQSRDICRDWGVDATVICDPAFYCDAADYEPLEKIAALEAGESYTMAYILDPDDGTLRRLHEIAQASSRRIVAVTDLSPKNWVSRYQILTRESFPDVSVKKEVDVFEWLWYYRHCEAVITDSYHGTIFSVIYRKPFISRINRRRGAARFESLGKMMHISERLFDDFPDAAAAAELLRDMDFSVPAACIEESRAKAFDWIRQAIWSPKEVSSRGIYEYTVPSPEASEQ